MIPKPPFVWDLSPEKEAAEYRRLQARLPELWAEVFPRDDQAYTSVVVPSLTLDQEELDRIEGPDLFEEQLLFFLIRLRNPRARVVYITSQPIHPLVLEYYLQLLAGIPASHARSRVKLLCAYDATPRPLIEKILERPRLIERIRVAIPDRSLAYMTVFASTPLERRLAVLLGIPVNGLDPQLTSLSTRSGSRRFFREAGFACPEGAEDLRDRLDVQEALRDLRRRRPGLRRAFVKLDSSLWGEGNAVFSYPDDDDSAALGQALDRLCMAEGWDSAEAFFSALARRGGVVEELVETAQHSSPSVQIRINPRGQVSVSSTHEHLLGGPTGERYEGCRFPADDAYRMRLHEAGARIGALLAARGVFSRVSLDFAVCRDPEGSDWRIMPLEIDFRVGSTTHAMLALRFLTGGRLDPETSLFRSPQGLTKYYRATQSLYSPAYRGLVPDDLIELLTVNHLDYDRHSETGVLFQMIGGLSQYGRLGLVAIGNSREEAEQVFMRTVTILDYETRFGPPGT